MHKRLAYWLCSVLTGAGALAAAYATNQQGPGDVRLMAPRAPSPLKSSARISLTPVSEAPVDDVDPFAPRDWQPPQAPAPIVDAPAAPIIALPPEPATPTAPPSLPFKFMGRLSEDGAAVVYLSRGEESWTVKGGEILDNSYKVLSVTSRQVVFEHAPTGTQQILDISEPDK